MARRVLVPLDGSPAAERALGHASALATALGDGLRLLQVLEPVPAASEPADVDWRLRRAESTAYLRSVAERLADEGVDVETTVASGTVAAEIVRHASEADVEYVVLTTHGAGAATAFEAGGTCHQVLSRVPVSVLLVRRSDRAAPLQVGFRGVLVPVDGSQASEWALGQASTLARRFDATLHVLHLVATAPELRERLPRSSEEGELTHRLEQLEAEHGQRYLDDIATRLAHTGLTVRTHLRHAVQFAHAIRSLANDEDVDLIALSAHGVHGAPFHFGTVPRRLLSSSERPVLVFQDAPPPARDTAVGDGP